MNDEVVPAASWKIACFTNKKSFKPDLPSYSDLHTSGRISGTVWKLTSESVITNPNYCAMTLVKDQAGILQVMIRYLKDSGIETASGFSVIGTWVRNKSAVKESDPIFFEPAFLPPSSPVKFESKPSEPELDAIAELVLATLAYAQQVAFSALSEVVAFPEGQKDQVSELKNMMLQNSYQLWWTVASPKTELQKRYEYFQLELKCAALYEQSYKEIQTLEQEVSNQRQKETEKLLRLLSFMTGTFAIIQGISFVRGNHFDAISIGAFIVILVLLVWRLFAVGIFKRKRKFRSEK